MMDIAEVLTLGVDTTPVEKGIKALDNLVAASGRAEKAVGRWGSATRQAGEETGSSTRKLATDATRSFGAVEQAQMQALAASRALRDQRALEAAAMREAVIASHQLQAAELRAAREAENLARKVNQIEKALDPMAAVTITAAERVKVLDRALATGAITADRHAAVLGRVNTIAAGGAAGLTKMGGAAKLSAGELANLSFQANDVFVSLASGQRPFQVLVQQGAQIGQVFQMAAARGVGFGAAMSSLGQSALPIVARLGPVAVAAGVAYGGFALAAQQLNKEHGDLEKSLGLTDEQLKKVGDTSITAGDVMKGSFEAASKALTDTFAPELKALESVVDKSFDWIAKTAVNSVKMQVGTFVGGYEAIKATYDQLPRAIGDAAISAANKAIEGIEGLINRAIDGLNEFRPTINAFLMATGSPIRLPELDRVSIDRLNNEFAGAMDKLAKDGRAAFDKGFAKGSGAVDSALEAAERGILGAYEKRIRGLAGEAKATRDKADATKKATEETLKAVTAGKEMNGNYISTIDLVKRYNDQLKLTPAALDDAVQGMKEFEEQGRRAAMGVLDGFDALFQGIRSKNWGSALGGLSSAISNITGSLGGIAGKIGGAAQGAFIGQGLGLGTGKGGIDLALGLGGGLAGAAFAGTGLATTLASYAGTAATGVLGAGGASALTGILGSASFLGPVAAIVALGLGKLLAGKPSNMGAGIELSATGVNKLTGDRRTAETESAAKAAADAVLQGQAMLDALGIAYDRVHSIVLGSRDDSQITLASGRMVKSAVGDNAAAAEAGLRAVLESAKYQSDAQRKVAESALAAGQSFDQVLEQLTKYEGAQGIGKMLGDRILELTDPKGFALSQLADAQAARVKEVQAAVDAGFLTADQFAAINVQLEQLKGLELNDTLKQFADSVEDATEAQEAAKQAILSLAADMVSRATSDLQEAYDAAASPIRAMISEFESLADTLRQFNDSSRLEALSAAGLRQEFDRVGSLAAQGDKASLQAFTSVASAYRDSIAKTAPDALTAAKESARIRRISEDALKAAESQVDYAKAQLDALDKSVAGLLNINKSVLSVRDAILALQSALATQRAVTPTIIDGLLGLTGKSFDEYRPPAVEPISLLSDTPGYASGGMHRGGLRIVGEEGPELEATGPARIWSAQQTAAMVGGGGDNSAVVAELRRQNTLLEEQNALLRTGNSSTRKTADLLTNVTRDGEAMYTADAA